MANLNQGKQVGESCAYCGQTLIQGNNGAYCRACYIAYKNKQKGQQPRASQAPRPPQNQFTQPVSNAKRENDIRENVALKMVSELVSAGKIDLAQWELWANKFYFYKPSFAKPITPSNTTSRDSGDWQEEAPTPPEQW